MTKEMNVTFFFLDVGHFVASGAVTQEEIPANFPALINEIRLKEDKYKF